MSAEERYVPKVTIGVALKYAARVMPDLFFRVLAGMPEEIQESTLETLSKPDEGDDER